MNAGTYRDAARHLRATLDLIGPYRCGCGLCGHPDGRHRIADAITGRLLAGEDVGPVGADLLPDATGRDRDVVVLLVAVAVLAASPRRHGITRGKAAEVDREVWADLSGRP